MIYTCKYQLHHTEVNVSVVIDSVTVENIANYFRNVRYCMFAYLQGGSDLENEVKKIYKSHCRIQDYRKQIYISQFHLSTMYRLFKYAITKSDTPPSRRNSILKFHYNFSKITVKDELKVNSKYLYYFVACEISLAWPDCFYWVGKKKVWSGSNSRICSKDPGCGRDSNVI